MNFLLKSKFWETFGNKMCRIWGKFGECLNNGNIKEADEIKNAVEERQRALVKERQKNKEVWKPKYFDVSPDGKYSWKGK